MTKIDWLEAMGWGDDQVQNLRVTAYAYIRQGKYDIALPIFEALTVLCPDSAYDSQTLGALYLQLNEPKKALKVLDNALKIEGDHAPTLLNVCKCFFMLGKNTEGLQLANILSRDEDPQISNIAKALILAYS